MKEGESKDQIIRSGEVLLARIDDELWKSAGEERLEATKSGL
jgi:hypothetical protein